MRTSLTGIAITFALLTSAQAQTPSFTAASVTNAASMKAGSLAPGMVAEITGTNLGDPSFFRSCTATYPITTLCAGISVLINGTAVPVLNNSSTEVTFQVPFTITGSTATVQVTSNLSGATLSSGTVTVPVAPTAPGLYSVNGTGSGTGYYLVTAGLITQYSSTVRAGDTVIMFGTGFGATNPAVAAGVLGPNSPAGTVATTTMTINNQTVTPTFAGLEPGNLTGAIAGYDEVVFTVPSGLTVPAGQTEASYPVVVTVGGVASNSVNLRVVNSPPNITSISPNPVPLSASPQTVTINGTGFQSGLSVKLTGPNGSVTLKAPDVTVVSATQMTVNMTSGTTAGTWSAIVTNADGSQSDTFIFTASGTATNTPTITSILTASSQSPAIAPNTWLEIHGTNLANTTRIWATADFVNGQLPTTIDGVSAKINNKAAAVYYVSQTQINVLAPLDTAVGPVTVQLNTPNGLTQVATVAEQPLSPAFLVADLAGHIAAQHLDYTLVGAASLSVPGYVYTPAKPGEEVVLWATGFGQTTPAVTDQLPSKNLVLSGATPVATVGGVPATVKYAGLSGTGLYQLNVVVPLGTPTGDATVLVTYNGSSTQNKAVITVQQ